MHNKTISLCDIIYKYSLIGKQNSWKHGVSTIDSHYRIFVDYGSEVWRNLRIEVHSHKSGVL
jgi:hypothetical protein